MLLILTCAGPLCGAVNNLLTILAVGFEFASSDPDIHRPYPEFGTSPLCPFGPDSTSGRGAIMADREGAWIAARSVMPRLRPSVAATDSAVRC